MSPELFAELEFDTLAVRAGVARTNEGEHSEAMFLTSSFAFESAAQAAARFGGTEAGNIYSRFTNPTVRMFEQRLAALEGGERAVATSSGMAAILATMLAFLSAGDHVVCSRAVFGTTNVLFEKYFKKFGVETTFVNLTDIAEWQAAIKSNTKLFFLETPSNPICEVADIPALAALAHQHGILLAVDNCFCTPALQKPLALGADLIIHSATKYLDGQGRALGGAVVGSHKLLEEVYGVVRTCGPSMSPFNAWVFLKGLETLRLRMEAHSANALALATWLAQQPKVKQVNYAGLPTHPQHQLAAQQQRAFGGVLSFVVEGEREGAWRFIDGTKIMSITANLGDAKTTITHPASTTHGRLSAEAKAAAHISEGLIRIAVGLEDINDLKADCERGFANM
ncbi:MAG TPA: O-succinylhomoserine sulfhydrylase [Agitococcus sp.]|nr:O-succinylhomoserine sulfhydrylase [Agitococcus sp.]HMV60643.1 O-succinylhomoserine sulfhydrylase [Agitococcus sp.]HMX99197.1 O-succinylhomoserine sulfhydrylase [Agitococcus sp.]HMY81759.1 O-succinylhomoserine sulfhydrylase [Agitococcus sp.]HNG11425.1 O-succinylhomoserine sulfhydrylase [Agitococcus sp.]